MPSLLGVHNPVSNSGSNSKLKLSPSFELSIVIESPPLVCYGPPAESTGALLSGLLSLDVHRPNLTLRTVRLELVQEVRCRKPYSASCDSCTHRRRVLETWELLSHPSQLSKNVHAYPFSYLMTGILPATVVCGVASISYTLVATAIPLGGSDQQVLNRAVNLSRSILPTADKRSLRIFPPTALTTSVLLPSVVYPASSFPLELTLEGVTNEETGARWRMRKVSWRIDETSKINPFPCTHHHSNDSDSHIEETRTVGAGDVKKGWKTDFSGKGKIELIGEISTHTLSSVCCNVADVETGLTVTHALVVEVVVAEEEKQVRSNAPPILTGAARVLRMQFSLNFTDRPGLGIAWDDEVPPTYEDVPVSPPGYQAAKDPNDVLNDSTITLQ